MTIRGIRWLQNLCRGGLVLAIAMTPALFLVESPGITRWILLVMLEVAPEAWTVKPAL